MSQENVEVVVSALEKWDSGDDTGALESFAADVEVHHNIGHGTPLEGIYRGHAEVRKLWADIRESFAEARFDIVRATEHTASSSSLALSSCAAPAAGPWRTPPSGLSRSSSTELESASSSGPETRPRPSKPWGCGSSALASHRLRGLVDVQVRRAISRYWTGRHASRHGTTICMVPQT